MGAGEDKNRLQAAGLSSKSLKNPTTAQRVYLDNQTRCGLLNIRLKFFG
jgi:hypothetical protein